MKFKLPLSAGTVLSLDLKGAYLKGTLSSSGVASGVLAGGVSQTDINNTIIPALATTLNTVVQDPLTDATTKSTILGLFDLNLDGAITTAEVAQNTLIKTFLAADVDVDNDGVKELSLGLTYTAVPAVITP